MAPPPESDADAAAEHVILNIDGLDELSAIREALDDIRDDFAWWINNHRREQWLPVQPITSMPLDPLAEDWAQRLSTVTAADLPEIARPPRTAGGKATKTPADGTDGIDDEAQFCCEAPELQWTGNPHDPGVACMNCGYIVADCGSVVMQPTPESDRDPEPKEQQRGLSFDE